MYCGCDNDMREGLKFGCARKYRQFHAKEIDSVRYPLFEDCYRVYSALWKYETREVLCERLQDGLTAC